MFLVIKLNNLMHELNLLLFVRLTDISQKEGKGYFLALKMESLLKKTIKFVPLLPLLKKKTNHNEFQVEINKNRSQNLPLTAFNFAIKALRRCHVNIIKGN